MKIQTYILARNEELLMPYIIRHYSQFSDIIILINNSTDKTIEIAHNSGAEIWKYKDTNAFSLEEVDGMKANCWKESNADWVIVVDADEFVYHPEIVRVLSESKATIIHPTFHNMFSEVFPTTKGQIYDEVTMGSDGDIWLSKMNVFKPREITNMNWGPGGHSAYPEGNVIIDNNSGVKTLHMRFLSRESVLEKHIENDKRRLQSDQDNGYGIQLEWREKEINDYYERYKSKLTKII